MVASHSINLGDSDHESRSGSFKGHAVAAAGSSKAGHDDLGSSARREIAAVIRITDDRSRVCDVYPLGIRSGWIERHAERTIQARREDPGFPRFGLVIACTKDANSARL